MTRPCCFLSAIAFAIQIPSLAHTQCVYRTIDVSRVQGTIADPLGQPIEHADVVLKRAGMVVSSAETDNAGRFSIPAAPGKYELYVTAQNFSFDSAPIDVGSDLVRVLRPTHLWIIIKVARQLDDCGLIVTTRRRQFEKTVRPNQHDN
jgi:Carboxypeptidase regulatory-like domain